MIINNWEELKKISHSAYRFLVDFHTTEYADGRYDLSGGLYVNIESYQTADRERRRFEAHREYIDVQYMISGEELIAVADKKDLEEETEYDEIKDIIFYKKTLKGKDYLLLPKMFLLLEPDDAHMPCICINGNQNVRKAVIKIPYVYKRSQIL